MHFTIPIPDSLPAMTVKELLEDYFLIPRKIRHFLRTKKQVRVNGQVMNWQSTVCAGDLLELTFDEEDYPENILRLVVKKSPTGESTHYFFHSQDDKVEVSC